MNYFLSLQNGAGPIWCNRVHSSCHQHSNSSDRHVPAIKIQGFSYFCRMVGNTVRHLDIWERTVHCQTPSHRLRLPPSESQSKVSFDMDLNDLHLIPYPRPVLLCRRNFTPAEPTRSLGHRHYRLLIQLMIMDGAQR